jgi:SpoVK/Ycf46/Vps4 family AAA+-type ATPase
MMRPGRVDAIIEMGNLSKESMINLIKVTLGPNLAEEVDADKLWEAATGYTPSFITGACQRAILYALERVNGDKDKLAILSSDIEESLKGLRSQFELMSGDREITIPTLDQAMHSLVNGAVEKVVGNGKSFIRAEEIAGVCEGLNKALGNKSKAN